MLHLVYHGRLCEFQKRSLDLVALLEQLDARGVPVRFTLIGGGEARPAIEKRGARFIADGRLVLLGTLSLDKTLVELGQQDVYVLPSDFEGTPNALLEAMAHGCVPVVSRIDTLIKIVRDGDTGFTCPPGDIDAFATAVARLAEDPVSRAAMARRAASSVRELGYDLGTMIDRYQSLFDRLEARPPYESRRPRRFMQAPAARLGGVNILKGNYNWDVYRANQVPFWPDPRPQERFHHYHRSQSAPFERASHCADRDGRLYERHGHLFDAISAGAAGPGIATRDLIALSLRACARCTADSCWRTSAQIASQRSWHSWQRRWETLRRILTEDCPCIYIPNFDCNYSRICGPLPDFVKVLGIVHSDDPAHYDQCLRDGATWNAVLSVSDAITREIKALAPDLADRLHTIPFGVALPAQREPSPRPANAPLRCSTPAG